MQCQTEEPSKSHPGSPFLNIVLTGMWFPIQSRSKQFHATIVHSYTIQVPIVWQLITFAEKICYNCLDGLL